MPSQLLHVLFGEDVFPNIPAAHRKAFALGCQGPDIFYHSQERRPVALEYGTLLHRRGAGSFAAELLGGRNEIDALGAYALGFATHAILDRHSHPYIIYKTEVTRYVSFHAFFERILDVLMLKLLRGAEITSWDQGMLAEACENPPPGLKELLAGALIATYPERAGKDEKLLLRVENAFLDCAGFYRRTAPACLPDESRDAIEKQYLVYLYPMELPGGIDFLNLSRQPWYYPAGEKKEDRRSFPEIYAGALKAAADSFSGVISRHKGEAFPLDAAAVSGICDAIGNGGLNIVDESGKPCAPCRTEPLPLGEVLERQAELRHLL
ncbi:MAG: zinc dependent phospholipase C family protein [Treponema sp.]|jgi:hypothetical protein|nr:zinc dependent phospholipase C family protein [Treponema sp.]